MVGYDPGAGAILDQVYGLYILASVLGILTIGWAGAINAAWQLGQALARTSGGTALAGIVPAAVLVAQSVLVTAALYASPLKFTFADMAYVAFAPLASWAVVAVAFWRSLPLRLLAVAAAADLASILLGDSLHLQGAAALTGALLYLFTILLAWDLGCLRLTGPNRRPRLWGLGPLAAGILLWRVPGVALWPGRLFRHVLLGPGPLWHPTLLWLILALALVLAAVGTQVNLIRVVEENHGFAQERALGPVARTDPDALQQLRAGRRLAGRRPHLGLPAVAGAWVLAAHLGLSAVRLPGRLLTMARDLGVVLVGCWVLFGHGTGVPWGDWVLASIILPPRGVADAFVADSREPFLRQLLPFNDLQLLVGDAGGPVLLVFLLTLLAWVLRRPPGASLLDGAVAAAVLLALRALSQGVAAQRPGGPWRPPFAAVAGVCYGVMAAIAVHGRAPEVALAVGGVLAGILALAAATA